MIEILMITESMQKDTSQQQEFFISYAHQNLFDPLVADNWYHVDRESIMKFKVLFKYHVFGYQINLQLTGFIVHKGEIQQ